METGEGGGEGWSGREVQWEKKKKHKPFTVSGSFYPQLLALGLFILLIRFHLKVRSYGICLSPLGLNHLA